MIHEIFIVDNNEELIKKLKVQFANSKELVLKLIKPVNLLEHLSDIPSLILINEDNIENNEVISLCRLIRNNEDNSITPIVLLTSNDDCNHEKELLKEEVEYYIRRPTDDECIFYIIRNIVKLLYMNRGVSPLTKLPRKLINSIRIEEAFNQKARICCIIL